MEEWSDELTDLVIYLESAMEEVHNAAVAADEMGASISEELLRIEEELAGLLLLILPGETESL